MFIHVVKSTKKGQKGGHCMLVESVRKGSRTGHVNLINFGFVPQERIPYLKAAFNSGDPAQILTQELEKLSPREESHEEEQGK